MSIKRTLRRGKNPNTPSLTESDIRKIKEFDVNDVQGNHVRTLMPHELQVGLDDPRFKANVVVKGKVIPEQGVQFSDGTSITTAAGASGAPVDAKYVVYGADATLTNELIIVDGDGVSATQSSPNITLAVDIDTNPGLGFNGGKLKLDTSTLTALGASVDAADYVTIYHTQTATTKKALVSNLPFTNNAGTVTPSSTDTFTNKSGNISQWTNDSNFIDSAGAPIQSVDGNTGVVTSAVTSVNGDTGVVSLAYSDLTAGAPTATDSVEGLVEYATNVEVAAAASTSVVIRPSSISSIATSDLNNDAGFTSNTGTVTPGSTNTFTNKTFDAAGTGNSITNIPNASLDNSTISGVSLGNSLGSLTIGNGIALNSGTTYNGSAARTLSVDLDGSTLSSGVGGIAVVSTPGALTLGTGLTGTSFDGSGNVTAGVDFGNTGIGNTYTNATLTLNDDGQITNCASGQAAGGSEYGMIAGYRNDDYQVASSTNSGTHLFSFQTSTAPDNDFAFQTLNQGSNFTIPASSSTFITINNTGTYIVNFEIGVVCSGGNSSEWSGHLALLKDDNAGSWSTIGVGPEMYLRTGHTNTFSAIGVAVFSNGGTMKLGVIAETATSGANALYTLDSGNNLNISIEKVA